jgi:integrase
MLHQINPWTIERYKSQRQKDITRYGRPPAKATINRELALLKHLFTKAIEWGLVSSDPTKKVKLFPEKPNKLRVLSNDEFQKLHDAASDFLKPILVIAVNTGMRRNEILNLTWDDIDLVRRHIYIGDSKNNERRIIPINETLFRTLKALKKSSQNKYLFANRNGGAVKSVKKAFWGALRRSGIAHCRLHDLRHTFASNLVMAGVDIVTVQELMGHKDISMTKRYSHPTPQHKKQAVERLKSAPIDTYLDTRYTSETLSDNVTSLNHYNVPVAQQDRAQDS